MSKSFFFHPILKLFGGNEIEHVQLREGITADVLLILGVALF